MIEFSLNNLLLITEHGMNLASNNLCTFLWVLCSREDGSELTVHFNLYFDPRRHTVLPSQLTHILSSHSHSVYLANRTLDPASVHVMESSPGGPSTHSPATLMSTTTAASTTAAPRSCASLQLPYCAAANHNVTTYPNIVGHQDLQQVLDNVIAFRWVSYSVPGI